MEASCEGFSTATDASFVAFVVARFGAADDVRFVAAEDDFFVDFFSVT